MILSIIIQILNLLPKCLIFNCYISQINLLSKKKSCNTISNQDIGKSKSILNKGQETLNNHQPLNRSMNPTDQSGMIINTAKDMKLNHSQFCKLNETKKKEKEYNNEDIYTFNHLNMIEMLFLSLFPCIIHGQAKHFKAKYNCINHSLSFYRDLLNVYRKLMEVDILKYLLLTNEQLSLYQVLSKLVYRNLNKDTKRRNDFEYLIHNPNFHFLKSKKYLNKAIINPDYKTLIRSEAIGIGNSKANRTNNCYIHNEISNKLIHSINQK